MLLLIMHPSNLLKCILVISDRFSLNNSRLRISYIKDLNLCYFFKHIHYVSSVVLLLLLLLYSSFSSAPYLSCPSYTLITLLHYYP